MSAGRTSADLAWLETAKLVIRHAGTAHYPPGAVIGPRRIGDAELVWIDAGDGSFEGGDGARIALLPGTVLLVRPGERHRFVMGRTRMLAHGFVHLTLPAAAMRALAAWPRPVLAAPGSALRAVLAEAERLLAVCPQGAAEPRLAVRLALALYLRAAAGEAEPAWTQWRLDPLVARVLGAVRARWREEPAWAPGRAALVALSGVGEATLARAFRRALGVGPAAAVRRWRIERAAMLLARGGVGVGEAARLCGWADPDVFARAFRAAYGLTPRAAAARAAAAGWLPLPLLRLVSFAGGRERPALAVDDPSLPPAPSASGGAPR